MSELGYQHFFTLSLLIFCIGTIGLIINRKNLILILMAVEIILLSANINLVSASVFLDDIQGQILTIFVLTIALIPCSPYLSEQEAQYLNSAYLNASP